MKVNDRSKLLLSDIINNDNITLEELKKRHNLSTRQVDYSIQKMNEVLEERQMPRITKTANGRFKVDKKIYFLFQTETPEVKAELFVSDSRDRAHLIVLMMLLRKVDFSINFFIDEFKISKNTVLNDLKQAKKVIKPFKLKITYSRIEGYEIKGKEWDCRNVMIHSINYIMNQLDGERYLKYYLKISKEMSENINQNLLKVETALDLSFVDTKTIVLPYIFLGILFRIELGHHLRGIFFIDYRELADTREYDAVKVLIKDVVISEEEKMYFTLHLLSSNIYQREAPLTEELPQLREVIKEFIDEFERVAFTTLSAKESLVNKIFIHFKPAYYRIKYQLTTDYKILPTLDTEYGYIHHLIKESITPLVTYLGRKLPEIETMFISMLIGGHLLEQSNQLDAKFRGVIVCQNGLSFSNLLSNSLKNIFPELFFYPPMSLKELKDHQQPYDLIFTSVLLESEKPVFYINDLSEALEVKQIRNKVMSVLYQFDDVNLTIEDIIHTAAKHAKNLDVEKLRTELVEVFVPVPAITKKLISEKGKGSLAGLLTMEMISKVRSIKNWHEALDLVSQPLLARKVISPTYVATIKEEQARLSSRIVLRGSIAIPHTSPEIDTGLGMSLLVLEEPLRYEGGKEIFYIVMIASPNKKAHFKALLELLEIAENNDMLLSLKNQSVSEIKQMIDTYNYREIAEEE